MKTGSRFAHILEKKLPENLSRLSLYRAMLAQSAVMRLHVVCPSVRVSVCQSVTIRYRDHIGYNTSKIISPPNSDKIVMWTFLRNRRLILRLHTNYFQGTHILVGSRGYLCDSVASCLMSLTTRTRPRVGLSEMDSDEVRSVMSSTSPVLVEMPSISLTVGRRPFILLRRRRSTALRCTHLQK